MLKAVSMERMTLSCPGRLDMTSNRSGLNVSKEMLMADNPVHGQCLQACALYGVRYGMLFTVRTVIL
jgi:hypothetical protein